MFYPQKINAKSTDLIIKIAIVISVIVGFSLVLINRIFTPNILWAGYCNAGIIYIWITVLYSINKNINIAGHVLVQTIAISLLTVYIDYKTGFKAWSINLAIPIIIIIANITMLILTIISYKKYIKYAVYQLLVVIVSTIPIFLVYEDYVQDKTLSIINEWALKDKRIKKRDRIALYSTIFGFSFYKFVWKLYKKLTGREK